MGIYFHGGCIGCTQARAGGTKVCVGCKFFECNWDLPDLNDQSRREKEEIDAARKNVRKKALGRVGYFKALIKRYF